MSLKRKSVLFCGILSLLKYALACGDHSEVVNTLLETVSNQQVKETRPYTGITSPEETEGTYRSYAFVGAHGSEEMAVLRRNLKIQDDHPFPSGVVGPQLLDAFRFGNAPMPSRDDIMKIVKLFGSDHNKNLPYNNSILSFYPQKYNPGYGFWVASFYNVIRVLSETSDMPEAFQQMFLNLLIGSAPKPDGFAEVMSPEGFLHRFTNADDFDTTSLNLALGAILSDTKDTYPEAFAAWMADNTNLTSVFDRVKKSVYRPFSDDRNVNTIDTRSYFFMRDFLGELKSAGKDGAFVPCWDMNIGMGNEYGYLYGILPFGVNQIDVGICSNFVSDVFAALDAGLVDTDIVNNDEDLTLIIESTGALVIYNLANNLTDRPDLSLVYYVTEYEFNWLAARGLLYMENAKLKGTLQNMPVYERYYIGLSQVMRTTTTKRLMDFRKFDADGAVYYDDFLGNADLNFDGTPIARGEDRYFSTAMSALSLIYTWSVYDEEIGSLRWIDSVPDEVKSTLDAISRWFLKDPLGTKYGVSNALYCAGFAGRETYPFWYPANRYEYFNGTKLGFDYVEGNDVIFGMEGYVTPEEYQKLLDVDQFGAKTPMDFHGRNEAQGAGIYWDVKAISYAAAMMTLSMTDALQKAQCDK